MPFVNKEARVAYQREWIAKRRQEFFTGKSCVSCGSTTQLELDHIDPSQKVSHRIWSWSADRRNAEIAKCQILCTDCHLEKTRAESRTAKCGDDSKYRRGCRCSECRLGHRLRMRQYRAKKRMERAA